MRRPVLLLAFLCLLPLRAQFPGPGEVQERRLPNGIRLLVVSRPGLPAFHATLVFRGGWAEEPPSLPGATELLARALYGATWPEDVAASGPATAQLEALLQQEDARSDALRLARLHPGPDAPARIPALEADLQQVRDRVTALQASTPMADLYAGLGGRQSASAEADALLASTELPVADFPLWCRTETQRLDRLELSRFFQARALLLHQLAARRDPGPALLRGAAFPGHPYGLNLGDHLAGLEAIRWQELRAYARQLCSPDRLAIVLVGGLDMDTAYPALAGTLGALPTSAPPETPIFPDLPSDLGDRQIRATLGSVPRLLVGWRIPPRGQPDHGALALAARLLGEAPDGVLVHDLVDQKRMAKEVAVHMDQPGGRHGGLLTLELQTAQEHSLAELADAVNSEILRFQEEAIPPGAWQRALASTERDRLEIEDTPGRLARALAEAWAETGDWRTFYSEARRTEELTPEAVQAAVQAWLTPGHRTIALLEPALQSQDPQDAETRRVLQALAARRIQDPGLRERLVAEGLRQLQMLPREERQRTLKLLLAQIPAVKQ